MWEPFHALPFHTFSEVYKFTIYESSEQHVCQLDINMLFRPHAPNFIHHDKMCSLRKSTTLCTDSILFTLRRFKGIMVILQSEPGIEDFLPDDPVTELYKVSFL